jgi:hypothetical protein
MKREENDITQHSQANWRTYYKHKVNHVPNPRSTYRLGTFSNIKARLTNSRSSLDFASTSIWNSTLISCPNKYKNDWKYLNFFYQRNSVDKKIKTKQNKMMTCYFYQRNSVGKIVCKLWTLFIMSITKRINDDKFHRYFTKSSKTIHFPIALLINVLYRQNHRWIEKLSVLVGGF